VSFRPHSVRESTYPFPVSNGTSSFAIELRIRVDGRWQTVDPWLRRTEALLDRYLDDAHLSCCSMQGGFFIDIDGTPWSDDSTVDEFWMTMGFLRGVDAIVQGGSRVECSPGPWEESCLTLRREGTILVMEDIDYSGRVSMPRISVDLRAFVCDLCSEAQTFCRLLEDLTRAASERETQGGRTPQLMQVRRSTHVDPKLIAQIARWPFEIA
jgi:hypothetical protein